MVRTAEPDPPPLLNDVFGSSQSAGGHSARYSDYVQQQHGLSASSSNPNLRDHPGNLNFLQKFSGTTQDGRGAGGGYGASANYPESSGYQQESRGEYYDPVNINAVIALEIIGF
jgi:hypothetical protein